MPVEFRWIQPEQISTTDDTFRVRSIYPEALASSIRENGIRTPLLVQPIVDRYRLVSGWGRWQARGDRAPIPCYLLPGDHTEEELWDVFLRDNERWNVVEIARILRRLTGLPGMTVDRIVREKFSLLGLRQAKDLYQAYLRLVDLPAPVQAFIEAEGLPLRRARVFFKLPPEALPPLLEMAGEARLTLTEISEVLELVEETSRRDGAAPLDVLREAAAGSADRTKRSLLERLRERRYPELSRYRAQLEAWRRELDFSVPVRIEWDAQLERPGIRLIADLADADALDTLRADLKAKEEALRRFFEIL